MSYEYACRAQVRERGPHPVRRPPAGLLRCGHCTDLIAALEYVGHCGLHEWICAACAGMPTDRLMRPASTLPRRSRS